jgi:hypothetical protein
MELFCSPGRVLVYRVRVLGDDGGVATDQIEIGGVADFDVTADRLPVLSARMHALSVGARDSRAMAGPPRQSPYVGSGHDHEAADIRTS